METGQTFDFDAFFLAHYDRIARAVARVVGDPARAEERHHVRLVLAVLEERQAELLLLRSSGLSYDEVAAAADVNPASVGTLISRAQQSFRKEYLKQYGQRN